MKTGIFPTRRCSRYRTQPMSCKSPSPMPISSQNVEKILAHFYLKLQSKAHEWRRILKTLNSIEFIIKNGSPNAIQTLKREIYKLQSLSNFSHVENGKDKGQSVREKIGLIVDLLNSDQQLMRERTEAYEYRRKFYPGTGPTPNQAGLEGGDSLKSGGYGGVPAYGGSS